jgi:hypothetical protein
MEDAERFRDRLCESGDDERPFLYRCDVSGEITFTADVTYVGGAPNLAPMETQIEYATLKAQLYWNGHRSDEPIIEVLAPPGSVTIIEAVNW